MEISKAKIKLYASLSLKKHRQKEGLFVVEGTKCVCDTLQYFDLEAVVATAEWFAQHRDLCLADEKCMQATHRNLEQISSLSTAPDVVAVYRIPERILDESLLEKDLTLVLDGVQDPGNLGTILRMADWFGITQVVASTDTVDVFNPKSIQATMGAISRVNVFYTDLVEFLKSKSHIPVYGTLLEGRNIYESEIENRGFIVMGNEGNGISSEVRKLIDKPLLIPAYPGDKVTSESLNVGVATAITVAEFRRRKQ